MVRGKPIYIPKEWIIQHYIMQDLTEKECAKLWGCSPSLIHKKIELYGIKGHPCTQRAHEKVRELARLGLTKSRPCIRGDRNPTKRPEVREKIRLSKLGPKNGMYGRCGKASPQYGKLHRSHGSWYINPWTRERIWLRGPYERRVADYLFNIGIHWIYEPKTFEMGDITYTPDFYLPTEDKFIEVKGWMTPESKIRIETFRQYHPEIQLDVWDPKKIVELGILTKHETKIKLHS